MEPKFLVERDLGGRVEWCIPCCNTADDLAKYLGKNPHDNYRLVSAQYESGSFILVWELK